MVHRMHPRSHVVKVHAYLASISFALSVVLCRFPPSLVAFVPFHPSFAKILTDALCTDGCIGKKRFLRLCPASQSRSSELERERAQRPR